MPRPGRAAADEAGREHGREEALHQRRPARDRENEPVRGAAPAWQVKPAQPLDVGQRSVRQVDGEPADTTVVDPPELRLQALAERDDRPARVPREELTNGTVEAAGAKRLPLREPAARAESLAEREVDPAHELHRERIGEDGIRAPRLDCPVVERPEERLGDSVELDRRHPPTVAPRTRPPRSQPRRSAWKPASSRIASKSVSRSARSRQPSHISIARPRCAIASAVLPARLSQQATL